MLNKLTLPDLKHSARLFAQRLNTHPIADLFGITDGKAVGTYVEHQFKDYLHNQFDFESGNSASGIDFPSLEVDLKVTSIQQPQSFCPFSSASQKVYGLGYHLLIFVYDKQDDPHKKVAHLNFQQVAFVHKECTGDFQATRGLREILGHAANIDDIIAFLEDRNLPLDEIGCYRLAEQILREAPEQGYLTISNARQWRVQYGRVVSMVQEASATPGVENVLTA
jgi:hypothetical protein